jgi:hypothetical protein
VFSTRGFDSCLPESVGRVGYYLPFIITGTILTSIGTGLISTLISTSSTGKWVGYQIIAGVGRGLAFQMASSLSPSLLSANRPSQSSRYKTTLGPKIFQ